MSDSDPSTSLAPALAAAALDIPVQVILMGPGVSHGLIGPRPDSRRQWGAVADLCGRPIVAEREALEACLAGASEQQQLAPWVKPESRVELQCLLNENRQVLHV